MIDPAAFIASLPDKARAVRGWLDHVRGLPPGQPAAPLAMRPLAAAFFAADDGYPRYDAASLDPETATDDCLRDVDFDALARVVPWCRRIRDLPEMFETTSLTTLVYAFEVAAREAPVDFEAHVRIFPEVLWAPMMCVAYGHGHAPMFRLRAPFIQDSWYAACVAYTAAVKSGRVRPDFELMAAMPPSGFRLVPDARTFPFTQMPAEHAAACIRSDDLVRLMLQAAYSWVDPEERHLRMFPRHHLTIKGVARMRARTRKVLGAVLEPDVAARIMRCYVPTCHFFLRRRGVHFSWHDHNPPPDPPRAWDAVVWESPIDGDTYTRARDPLFAMAAMAARIRKL